MQKNVENLFNMKVVGTFYTTMESSPNDAIQIETNKERHIRLFRQENT